MLLGLAFILPGHAQSDNIQTIDLIELAPHAVWTSSRGDVIFGDDQYGVTIADYRYNVRFNDGSIVRRTLYTPIFEFGVQTNVTGHFNLKLPQARKITLHCQVNALQNWMHAVGAECRVPDEGISLKPIGGTPDWFAQGNFSDGKPFDFTMDLTPVAGKDVEIILKAQTNEGNNPGLFHWTKAEVISEFDAVQGYDLSVCPSDISIIPQADPSHVKLRFTVRNTGNAASPGYNLTLTNRANSSKIMAMHGKSIPAGRSQQFEYLLPVSTGVETLRLSCLVSASNEEMTGNNEACFNIRLPCDALRIKRIEGLPRPWKADQLNVVFRNDGTAGEGYSLSYSLKDFWGKLLVVNKPVALPRKAGFSAVNIDLKPSLGHLLGWYEAEVKLRYKGRMIDNRSINISRITPRPNPLSPLMGIQSFFWNYSKEGVATDLELIRDLGARYVRCNGVSHTDDLLAQGNGEYVMTYIPNDNVGAITAQGYTPEIEHKIYKDTFAMVSTFKGKVKYYELGNEYNHFTSAENCAKMYKTIYAAAKAADPDCIVNTGGFGDKQGQEPAYSTAWFKKLYELAGDSLDNLTLHSYTLWGIPDRDEALIRHCNQPLETYIDILKSFGAYPAKNIWVSEYGWFAADPSGWDQQAQNTVRQYLLGAKYNIPMIQFLLMDPGYDNLHDGVHTEGLCFFNREPRPSFPAYAVLARQFSGASFVEEKPMGANSFAYVFTKQGKRFMYLWKSVAPQETLTVPALGKSVTVMDMMGNSRLIAVSLDGTVSLPLSLYPIRVDGLDIDGFKVISRKTAVNTGLAQTEAGSALYKKVKASKDPGAWVWWGIAENEWKASGSELVVSDYVSKAYDYMEDSRSRKANAVPSDGLVRCKHIQGVKVDGNLEEWGLLPSYQGRNHTMAPCDSKDLSFSFKAGWDDTYLYIAVDVTDNVVINEFPAQNAYNGDAIEFWSSALNNKTPKLGPGDYQYIFGVAGQESDSVFKAGGKSQSKCAVHRTDTGYTMEIAVPLSELLLSKITPHYVTGFDIAVDDADGKGAKEHQMLFHSKTSDVWMNPSIWGNMIFE